MKFIFLILTILGAVSCVSSESTLDKNKVQDGRNPSQATEDCFTIEPPHNYMCTAVIGLRVAYEHECKCPRSDGSWITGINLRGINDLEKQKKHSKNHFTASNERNHLIYVTNDTGMNANKIEEKQTLDKLKSTCSLVYGGQIDEGSIWTGTKKRMSTTFAAGVCIVD